MIHKKSPDFIIVGAPKSGTTSLNHYLSQHPNIYIPPVKELHYFGSDIHFETGKNLTKKEYISYFQGADCNQITGESSVFYLYSKKAPIEIKRHNPDTKIIIMLRHPIEAMRSLYQQYRFVGWEDAENFKEALSKEPKRRRGEEIPRNMNNPWMLYYTEIGKFGHQVQRYLDVFPSESINIILFETFIEKTPQVYKSTLRFLGLSKSVDYKPEFSVLNTGTEEIIPGLSRCIKQSGLLDFLKGIFPGSSWDYIKTILRTLHKLNASSTEKNISDKIEKNLMEIFYEDLVLLNNHVNVDISHWLNRER